MLIATWHLPRDGKTCADPGADFNTRLDPERAKKNKAIRQRRNLGFTRSHGDALPTEVHREGLGFQVDDRHRVLAGAETAGRDRHPVALRDGEARPVCEHSADVHGVCQAAIPGNPERRVRRPMLTERYDGTPRCGERRLRQSPFG
ncbi:hypothetical protein MRBLWH7_002686 [Microbacterium sp. LWH7-1.2]|uniref:hypothetical protein n=1 Tax=Microbacterium sp. LWH7-1.2 TaxID=3135257 RepID=UPI003138F1B8